MDLHDGIRIAGGRFVWVMGMVAPGDVVFSSSQFFVVQAEAVNGQRLDLLLCIGYIGGTFEALAPVFVVL